MDLIYFIAVYLPSGPPPAKFHFCHHHWNELCPLWPVISQGGAWSLRITRSDSDKYYGEAGTALDHEAHPALIG